MVGQLVAGDLQWTGTSSSGNTGKEDSDRGAGGGVRCIKQQLRRRELL